MPETNETVLLVVDVQNGFVNENSQHVVPVIERLAKGWGGPVVFTQYVNYPGSPYERLIGWTKLQSSPEIDLVPELRPYAQLVIKKTTYTAFTEEFTGLCSTRGWSRFAICGIDTDSCVLKTALDAFERDQTPFVLEDACASHGGTQAHEAGLCVIRRNIGAQQVVQSALFTATEAARITTP